MKIHTLVSILVLIFLSGIFFLFSKNKTELQHQKFAEILNAKNIYGFTSNAKPEKFEYLIFNFWATWCPPCIEETPSLVRFVKKNDKKYHLFAISQDSSQKEIEQFLITFPDLNNSATDIIWDNSKALSRKMNVSKLPETFIYSVKTNKVLKVSGSTNWESKEIEKEIQDYFNQHK